MNQLYVLERSCCTHLTKRSRNTTAMKVQNAQSTQRGMTLIVVLVALLVLALGLLATFRGIITDTVSTGAMAQRAKTLTATDAAMQQLKSLVDQATASGQELEFEGSSNTWFTTNAASPDSTFWSQCEAGNAACTSLKVPFSGYNAWGTVHPTGAIDQQGCSNAQYAAVAYVLSVMVRSAQDNVQSSAEAIYKVCFPYQG